MTNAPEKLELGWFARTVIRECAPTSMVESFGGDLLEEANGRVLIERGRAPAKRWITTQIARSIPKLLLAMLQEPGHFTLVRWAALAASVSAAVVSFSFTNLWRLDAEHAAIQLLGQAMCAVSISFYRRSTLVRYLTMAAWVVLVDGAFAFGDRINDYEDFLEWAMAPLFIAFLWPILDSALRTAAGFVNRDGPSAT